MQKCPRELHWLLANLTAFCRGGSLLSLVDPDLEGPEEPEHSGSPCPFNFPNACSPFNRQRDELLTDTVISMGRCPFISLRENQVLFVLPAHEKKT